MAIILFAVFFFSMLAVGISIIWYSIRNGISPMPTSPKVKKVFLESLPKEIKGTVLELGAGWGTLAFPLADMYPEASVIAYENSPVSYLVCRLRQWVRPRKNLSILRSDFFEASFQETSLVVCYLFPGAMKRLKVKFESELPSGALVAAHTFAIPGWTPVFTAKAPDLYCTPVYLYKR